MLEEDPDLPLGNIGLACCFYLRDEVARLHRADPEAATRKAPHGPAAHDPRAVPCHPLLSGARGDMLAIADMLLARGADVNAGLPAYEGSDHMLSTLYFAIGHAEQHAAREMAAGAWRGPQ
jgi:hypothetical protein